MPRIEVIANAEISASVDAVYNLLADYRSGHPRILPRNFFDLVVEEGGRGAGTVFRMQTRALGQTRTMRMRVEEPEPGRVLREIEPATGITTDFIVDPRSADRSQVTFHTVWIKRGLAGTIERLIAPPFLRRVYAEELRNLERVMGEQPST